MQRQGQCGGGPTQAERGAAFARHLCRAHLRFPLRSSQVGERVRDPAAAQAEEVLDLLQRADDRTVDISALGPRAATAAMMTAMPEVSTRRVWALEARVQAISGSVAGSRDSVLSGLRAWVSFHRRYLGSAGASA